MKKEQTKGMFFIGLGIFFLMLNGWITLRILTLIFGVTLINFGLIKLGSPSLVDCIKSFYSLLKF